MVCSRKVDRRVTETTKKNLRANRLNVSLMEGSNYFQVKVTWYFEHPANSIL